DAGLLGAATGEHPHCVCPPHRWYPVPLAPPMAAAVLERSPIATAELAGEVAASWPLPAVGVGLVELAGGPLSPMADDGDGASLTALLAPDVVVLVAEAGLGAINAVRLSAAAFAAGDLHVYLNRFTDGGET